MASHKVGRNDPCPCGSGKKHKFCCGGNDGRSSAGLTMNQTLTGPGQPNIVYVPASDEMLMNRVNREAHKIAESFDNLTKEHVRSIDQHYSNAAGIVFLGKQTAVLDQDDLRISLATLLSNVLKSFTAAFALIRTGWRLQPFMCLRNAYEALGVAIHLAQRPEDLVLYKNGKLDSTKTIASAKRLLPLFGRVWGDFSEQFTHVGEPFRHIQQGNLYTKEETDLWHCLFHLAFFIWFTYEVAELVFYDSAPVRHFWERVADREYRLHPSEETRQEERRLIEQYRHFSPYNPAEDGPGSG